MQYKYTVTTKEIFSRDEESIADSKEQIEQCTGVEIPQGVWMDVQKGKKGIAENESFVIIIQKI